VPVPAPRPPRSAPADRGPLPVSSRLRAGEILRAVRLAVRPVHHALGGRDAQVSKPSAQMLIAVNTMLSALLVSEGDRRRVRIEVERNQAEATVMNVADLFRRKMQQG
jgi:hypothetical protein